MQRLTSSPKVGTRAHGRELAEALFAETSFTKESMIPAALRKNPAMFFEMFEHERRKRKHAAVDTAAAAAAIEATTAAAAAAVRKEATAAAAAAAAVRKEATAAAADALAADAPAPVAAAPRPVYIKVTMPTMGKSKRVPFQTSLEAMNATLKEAFGIPKRIHLVLRYRDGAEDRHG